MHPKGSTPSATFEAAAHTARTVARGCLPLGIGVVMHLYPLCALRCVPLPWWSTGNLRRTLLLRAVDRRALILANAGSERAAGAHAPVTLSRTRGGVRIDGTYEYMSLAHVADIVLFSAPLADGSATLFCAADLHGDSVRIGPSRFGGSMAVSDTCSVTFTGHHVPTHRFIVIPGESALTCMAQYQRSWFQLLLGEGYLARIEQLQRQWDLPQPVEQIASLNELARLREYALHLLDEAAAPSAIEALARVTAAMKLRISWHAQSIAAALRSLDATSASELGYLKLQPTSDDRILRSITAGWRATGPLAAAPAP
jgi:alkylation response protein AidB-like acyl-CoA dehydrogenase